MTTTDAARSTRRTVMTARRRLIALAAGALLLGACADDDAEITGQGVIDEAREAADLSEQRQEDIGQAGDDSLVEMEIIDSTVEGNTAVLTMEVSGIGIVPADGDTSGRTGHFHVFVNTPPVQEGVVIAQGTGVTHSAANPIRVPDLPPGEHTLRVVLGDGNHARILPGVEAKATVTVE